MAMTTARIITMTNSSLIRLMTWLSPAFPIGGFAWSNGLETVCQNGTVKNASDLRNWIATGLEKGTIRNDGILLTAAHRGDAEVADVNALALALAGTAERYQETTELGRAFLIAAQSWTKDTAEWTPREMAYPVCIGWVAEQNEITLGDTLLAYLQSVASNQVQSALRLMRLGQQAGVEILASLEPVLLAQAHRLESCTLDDIGSSTFLMDVASMNHETLNSRIFRS